MTPKPAAHTTTPWGFTYDGSSDWSIGQAEDPQGMVVCNIWDRNDDRARANAAFIVRAVNVHEKLLANLKWLHETCKCHEQGTENECSAVEAIAKAEAQ